MLRTIAKENPKAFRALVRLLRAGVKKVDRNSLTSSAPSSSLTDVAD